MANPFKNEKIMENYEFKTRLVQKSHVFTKCTASSANGREYSLTKDTSSSSYRFDTNEKNVEIENETLENLGISIVDSKPPNFNRISPQEVSNYYKSLGEWQNVLPKTDYTYSPASRYYGKKINGVYPLIPNMSRRNIWGNQEMMDNEINIYRAENYLFEESYSVPSPVLGRRARKWTHDILSSVTKITSMLIRNMFFEIYKRFRRIRWSHNEKESSSTYANPNIWRKVLLVAFISFLLYFFTSNIEFFRNFVPSYQILNFNYIIQPFVKLFYWLTYLVVNIYELTYSSTNFVLSMISLSSKHALDAVSVVTFTPIYKFVCLFWSSFSNWTDSGSIGKESESPRVDVDIKQIERLFQHLLNENEAKFVKNVLNSEEFVNFMNEKLKKLEQRENEKSENLLQTFELKTAIFEKKLSILEQNIERTRSDEMNELKDQMYELRNEIKIKEARIENELVALLVRVVDLKENSNFDDLKNKFASLFRSFENAHFKIDKLSREFTKYVENKSNTFDLVFERSKDELKHDLRLSLEEMITEKLREWKNSVDSSTFMKTELRIEQLEEYVKEVVRKALEIYDADKTGQADYALESSGGIILSTRCTETKTANAQFSIFGIPLWHISRSPRTVIQPGVHPGECWAFSGSTGYLVIQLSERIFISGFTLEHIPKSLASNGTIDSAPKDFSVWALRWESDPESKLLGNFRFEEDGSSLQYFEAIRLQEPYQIVELKILSNHGKIDYTCLYRFRVHGIPT
ncbi:hypothetical protein PGB90_001113 [Kerria lacca]